MLAITAMDGGKYRLFYAASRNSLAPRQAPRKAGLDQPPSQREVRVVFGRRPNGVQVIGKNNNRNDERMIAAYIAERPAQHVNVIREQTPPPLGEIHREEEAAARNEIALVMHRKGWRSEGDPLHTGRAKVAVI